MFRAMLFAVGLATAGLSAWSLVNGTRRTHSGAPGSPSLSMTASTKALRRAPTKSDAWLAFALSAEQVEPAARLTTSALKMSFYTGFNDADVIAPRLLLLARVEASGDVELTELMRRQIRMIVERSPALIPTLATAYQIATRSNRQIMEAELQESDRDLLARLRQQ